LTVAEQSGAAQLIEVPMSDGVVLSALRLPAARQPAPAVVMLTPYRKEPWLMFARQSGLAQLGCNVVVADVRGLGGSGGEWDGPHSPREISDGVELLAWIATQEFCDGQTALLGPSYLGLNTLLITAQRPPSLRCVVSMVPPVDIYRDMWRRGGVPSHTNWGAMVAYSNQHRPHAQQRILDDFYLRTVADPFDSDRSRSRSVQDRLDQIEAPVLVIGGWYDYFLRGTVHAFRGLHSAKRLVVGNWGHLDPEARELKDEPQRWLRYWLFGEGDDPSSGNNVMLQVVGTGAWTSCAGWPETQEIEWERWTPVAAPTRITVPVSFETPATSIPPVPLPEHLGTNSGMALWGEAWSADTPPVPATTRYLGPVALRLVLESGEATDIDLHARLSRVCADGTVHQITEGRLRASHRALDNDRNDYTADDQIAIPWHPHDAPEALPVGEPVAIEVEIFPINLELKEGGSLRLGVTLIRADDIVAPTSATLLPETQLLLPKS
jgi:predicted acyl esterase